MKSAEIHHLMNKPLVIAVSSRALFDLEESHRIFEDRGIEGYRTYQVEKENEILKPGEAFPLVKKLLAVQTPACGFSIPSSTMV
jgi:5'-nucleotidase